MTKTTTTDRQKTARVSARMDHDLKNKAEIVLHKLGISSSEAINMFFAKILTEGGIPFELKLPKETMDAIQDVKEGKNVKEFNSSKELFKDLGI